MEEVTEEKRKEIEPTDFTMFIDDPLDPKVLHVTIPIKGLADMAEKGENIASQVGAHMFNFGIRALKTVSVVQAKRQANGLIKPGGRKLEIH